MDPQRVFKDLHNPSQAIAPYAMLIANCQELVACLEGVVFSFAKRPANSIAYSRLNSDL